MMVVGTEGEDGAEMLGWECGMSAGVYSCVDGVLLFAASSASSV